MRMLLWFTIRLSVLLLDNTSSKTLPPSFHQLGSSVGRPMRNITSTQIQIYINTHHVYIEIYLKVLANFYIH